MCCRTGNHCFKRPSSWPQILYQVAALAELSGTVISKLGRIKQRASAWPNSTTGKWENVFSLRLLMTFHILLLPLSLAGQPEWWNGHQTHSSSNGYYFTCMKLPFIKWFLSLLRYFFFTTLPSSILRISLSAQHVEVLSLTGMKRPTTCSLFPACSCCRWSSWSPATQGSSVRSPNDWRRTTVSLNWG